MNSAEIFRYAPKYISQRFYAINNYVWKSFFPENELNIRLQRLENERQRAQELARLKSIAGEATLVIFIILLRQFFSEGSNAAIQAVDTFKEVGVDSFQIGSKVFQDRNENVLQGRLLADQLIQSITSKELLNIITESQYPFQIINRYKDVIG